MERSPLFCSACERDLVLDEVVVAFGWPDVEGRGRKPPRFFHPSCVGQAAALDDGLNPLGERALRAFVLEELRERSGA